MRILFIVLGLFVACGSSKSLPAYPKSNDLAIEDDFELMELEEEVADDDGSEEE